MPFSTLRFPQSVFFPGELCARRPLEGSLHCCELCREERSSARLRAHGRQSSSLLANSHTVARAHSLSLARAWLGSLSLSLAPCAATSVCCCLTRVRRRWCWSFCARCSRWPWSVAPNPPALSPTPPCASEACTATRLAAARASSTASARTWRLCCWTSFCVSWSGGGYTAHSAPSRHHSSSKDIRGSQRAR